MNQVHQTLERESGEEKEINKSRGVRGWEEGDKMRKCEEKIETYLQKERVGGGHNVWFDLKYIQLSYKSQKYTVIP